MRAKARLVLVMVLASISVRLSAAEMAFQVLHEFLSWPGPSYPRYSLIEDADGSFLGTSWGGDFDRGTVYRITRSGQVTVQYSFDDPYYGPLGLTQMPNGNLCGIVGANQVNVTIAILKFSTNDWTVSTIGTSDEYFYGHPVFDGGQSYIGSNRDGNYNAGQILRITTNGTFTSLFSFNGTNGAIGYYPGSVIIGPDGALYGTTSSGGHGFSGAFNSGYGTVFKLTANSNLTTLAYFDLTNGASPVARLTFGSDHWLYGTTLDGGTNGGFGTVFRVSTNGVFQSLWSFDGTNGGRPMGWSGLIEALNGKFYGITAYGTVKTNARFGYVGTVFSLTTNGEFSVVARFDGTNGVNPIANMIRARDGNIYGVASDEVMAPSMNGNTGIFFRLAQVPEITSVIRTNGVTRLEWTSFTNGVYQVQSRSTLSPTNWAAWSSNLTATGSSCSYAFPAPNESQSFYRVALLP